MARPRGAAWAVQALLCMPLVACSAGSPSADTVDGPADVDISGYQDIRAVLDPVAETITYPIDAFFIDRAELGRIAQANALLLDACMREGGEGLSACPVRSDDVEPVAGHLLRSLERGTRRTIRLRLRHLDEP